MYRAPRRIVPDGHARMDDEADAPGGIGIIERAAGKHLGVRQRYLLVFNGTEPGDQQVLFNDITRYLADFYPVADENGRM